MTDVIFEADQAEGTVAKLDRWLVEVGSEVAQGQPIAEIETDKVTVEIVAPAAGLLDEILVAPGAAVAAGAVLGRVVSGDNAPRPAAPASLVAVEFSVDQAEGTTAAISRWLVAVGDVVSSGQPLVEIETDKVALEVVAPVAGTIHRLDVPVGQQVAPGTVLALVAAGVPAAPAVTFDPALRHVDSDSPNPTVSATQERRISPSVRRLLREQGLQGPPDIVGSGHAGRITRDDVQAWMQSGSSLPRPGTGAAGLPSRLVPHTNMRRSIARHMVTSLLHTAPHVTSVFEADLGAIIAHRKHHKKAFTQGGVALTFTAYFLSAAARALTDVPEVNARFHEDALEIFEDINIGVGTALGEAGLIVPVVRQVQQLDLLGIARVLADQTERARTGKLVSADLADGTFTISNHGVSGSLFAAPIIINQPQVAILGVGKIEKRVKVVTVDGEDKAQIRPMCYVSLSIDHRALDAHQTNRWLASFVATLQSWPLQAND